MLLFLTGCAWIGTAEHARDVATWSLLFQPVELCAEAPAIRATVDEAFDGVELALAIGDEAPSLSTVEQGRIEWAIAIEQTPETLTVTVSGQSAQREVVLAVVATEAQTLYRDVDGDGFGVEPSSIRCAAPGWSTTPGDCDDTLPHTNPDAPELCAPGDENCDGIDGLDPIDGTAFYPDNDADGYGAHDRPTRLCRDSPPPGMLLDGQDCDDNDPSIHPATIELCNEVDDDCDGAIDDDDDDVQPDVLFVDDLDGDGFGGGHSYPASSCLPPPGVFLANVDNIHLFDCDDHNPQIHPGAEEFCDGINSNCSTEDDSADPNTLDRVLVYPDLDGDGWGTGHGELACPGDALIGGDCDDNDPLINPAMLELCNSTDDDCDPATQPTSGANYQDVVVPTLADAIDAAGAMDTIRVCGAHLWPPALTRDITLFGHDQQASITGNLVIDPTRIVSLQGLLLTGSDPSPVLDATGADVVLEDVTIHCNTATPADEGAGIKVAGGALALRGTSVIEGCTAAIDGGAIHASGGSTVFLSDTAILQDNEAQRGGALYLDNSTLQVGGATFTNNTASVAGGAIFASGTPITVDTPVEFSFNSAASSGGAIYARAPDATRGCGTIQLDADTLFTDNQALIGGGVLLSTFDASPCTLNSTSSLRFSRNSANIGAALATRLVTPTPASPAVPRHTLSFENARFDGNITTQRAALFLSSVDLVCTQCRFGVDPDGQPAPNTMHDLEFSDGSFVDGPPPNGLSCSDDTTTGGCPL